MSSHKMKQTLFKLQHREPGEGGQAKGGGDD